MKKFLIIILLLVIIGAAGIIGYRLLDDKIPVSGKALPTATIRSSRKSPRRRSRLPSEIIPAIILNFSPKQEASPSAREISFLPQRTDIFISTWFCRKTPMQMRRRPRKTLSLPSNTALTEMYHRKNRICHRDSGGREPLSL